MREKIVTLSLEIRKDLCNDRELASLSRSVEAVGCMKKDNGSCDNGAQMEIRGFSSNQGNPFQWIIDLGM